MCLLEFDSQITRIVYPSLIMQLCDFESRFMYLVYLLRDSCFALYIDLLLNTSRQFLISFPEPPRPKEGLFESRLPTEIKASASSTRLKLTRDLINANLSSRSVFISKSQGCFNQRGY